MEDATKMINELSTKLNEARTIANELASTEILISDKRQKDIIEYVDDLREEFRNLKNYDPNGYYLVAEGETFEIRIQLNL